jgi:hypothetical protein
MGREGVGKLALSCLRKQTFPTREGLELKRRTIFSKNAYGEPTSIKLVVCKDFTM